jgi:hypothetical protein
VTLAAVVCFALVALSALAAWQRRLGLAGRGVATLAAVALLVAAAVLVAPAPAEPTGAGGLAAGLVEGAATRPLAGLGWCVTVVAAAAGGGPLAELVLRIAGRRRPTADGRLQAAIARAGEVLRGGATIGVLERAAVALTLLAGFPEGLAVVVAVKALGRYPELRGPGVSERFIIGTLASLLWAGAVAGVGAALFGGGPLGGSPGGR